MSFLYGGGDEGLSAQQVEANIASLAEAVASGTAARESLAAEIARHAPPEGFQPARVTFRTTREDERRIGRQTVRLAAIERSRWILDRLDSALADLSTIRPGGRPGTHRDIEIASAANDAAVWATTALMDW